MPDQNQDTEIQKEAAASDKKKLKPMADDDRAKLKIFISHRHDDMKYADVIRTELLDWGLSNEQIHQSSSSQAEGPTMGKELIKSLKEFLHACHLVIFVYTRDEYDWSWCAYEIGVAEDPQVHTAIVTYLVFADIPDFQKDKLGVKIESVDIQKFVKDFHTTPNFIPGHGAFYPTLDPTVLENRAGRLLQNLQEVKSKDTEAEVKPNARWGYIKVYIDGKLLNPLVDKYETLTSKKNSKEVEDDKAKVLVEVRDTLTANLIVKEWGQWGLNHFGISPGQEKEKVTAGVSLGQLENLWKASVDKEGQSWLNEIVDEIWAFRTSANHRLSWQQYRSGAFGGQVVSYFYPVVTHAYLHKDGSREYDITTFIMSNDGVKK